MNDTIATYRKDFPNLGVNVHGKSLVYLDNASTTHKPQVVIDAIGEYYSTQNSNVHRGVHYLSEQATELFERTRKIVQSFLHSEFPEEIVFTRGGTEAINLVAMTYGKKYIGQGDEVIISSMEHHSNIVPWKMLCDEVGATLKIIPMNEQGELDIEVYKRLFTENTKFVSVVHVSNALGTVNPVKEMVGIAHDHQVPVLVDGCQAVQHMPVDVQDLDCDFYVFTGHKVYGPTGTGILYGKKEILESMPPYQGGGDMIKSVRFDKIVYNDIPHRFEAGTPNIAGIIGLGRAIEYIQAVGLDAIYEYDKGLLQHATTILGGMEGIRIIGTAQEKISVLSFVFEGAHPHDIGTIVDQQGVAIRTGHHCAQPIMEHFGIPATARMSLAFYNTKEDIDRFVEALLHVREILL